jgi:hypothetical protein
MSGTKGARDKTGLITLSIPWYVDSLAEVLTVSQEAPLGLVEINRDWTDIEGAGFEVLIDYEGLEEGRDEGEFEYDFDPSFSEEPIETHPLISALVSRYDGQVDPQTKKVTFGPTMEDKSGGLSGGAGTEKRNPLAGLTTYISLRSVFRTTYSTRDLPGSIFKDIGTIKSSLPKQFPTPQGRDWLVMPPKVTQRGNAYQITEELMMSPPGGWPKNIYKLIET